ncbi:MAG: hypothetical protein EA376_11625 [Phycisphaeraceae bacterium]|nr:MAG: hypothetical protein EA376_11625 [Phycisphaeraceae bacterium]
MASLLLSLASIWRPDKAMVYSSAAVARWNYVIGWLFPDWILYTTEPRITQITNIPGVQLQSVGNAWMVVLNDTPPNADDPIHGKMVVMIRDELERLNL